MKMPVSRSGTLWRSQTGAAVAVGDVNSTLRIFSGCVLRCACVNIGDQSTGKEIFVTHNKALELLQTSGRGLRNLLFRMTLCEDTADDLMQELFLRLTRSRGFARSSSGFAYAWRTAVNLGLDHCRRKQPPALPAEPPAGSIAPEPLSRLMRDEQLRIILAELAKLKSPGRDIVVMRYLEQCDNRRIAERLGKNENYIRSQLSKTLAKLRQNLNGQLDRHD